MCNISRECVYLRRRRNIVGEATSFVRSTTLFAEGNLVLCPLIYNDVLALLEMMLTASGQTMLCPADTNTKRKHFPKGSVFFLEAPPRFGLGNRGFADLCLTTWLYHQIVLERFVQTIQHLVDCWIKGRYVGFEPTHVGPTNRCVNQTSPIPPKYSVEQG